MMLFSQEKHANNDDLRRAIYAGEIFKIDASAVSLEAVSYVRGIAQEHFGVPLENAHVEISSSDFMEKMRLLRLAVVDDLACREYVRKLMADVGFMPDKNAFDCLRLRAVMSDGHLNPALERSYSLHRDSWYANPQCQVNWWIALQDIPEERAFSFYPEYFNRNVENTSGGFDYDGWMKKVGWQSSRSQASFDYPQVLENLPVSARKTFSCRAGDILLFSASQLHQTNPHSTGAPRFSMDFRTVHLGDHAAGLGAPNVDNGSQPGALADYVMPG